MKQHTDELGKPWSREVWSTKKMSIQVSGSQAVSHGDWWGWTTGECGWYVREVTGDRYNWLELGWLWMDGWSQKTWYCRHVGGICDIHKVGTVVTVGFGLLLGLGLGWQQHLLWSHNRTGHRIRFHRIYKTLTDIFFLWLKLRIFWNPRIQTKPRSDQAMGLYGSTPVMEVQSMIILKL